MSELIVITSAKKLNDYIIHLSRNAQVKFRHTYVDRMNNYALDIIENLYFANIIQLGQHERYDYQLKAYTKLKLLDYICETSCEAGCITRHQLEVLAGLLSTLLHNLKAWMKSDEDRTNIKL